MPHEIEVTINNGKIETHIKGVKGTGCQTIEGKLKQAFGAIDNSEKTPEFHQKQHNANLGRVRNG